MGVRLIGYVDAHDPVAGDLLAVPRPGAPVVHVLEIPDDVMNLSLMGGRSRPLGQENRGEQEASSSTAGSSSVPHVTGFTVRSV